MGLGAPTVLFLNFGNIPFVLIACNRSGYLRKNAFGPLFDGKFVALAMITAWLLAAILCSCEFAL